MKNKFLATLVVLAALCTNTGVAYAYTASAPFTASECLATATSLGSTNVFTESSADCVSYCAALPSQPACCSVVHNYDIEGSYSSSLCTARNTTTISTKSNTARRINEAYTINYAAAPTATLAASSTSITSGSSTRLTWMSTNATSCTGTNITTSNATSGSVLVSPTTSTTYSVTCTGAGGTSPASSVTVTVTAPQTIDLTAGSVTPTTATVGSATTLTATISNTGGASSGAGFTNLFQRATDASGTSATDIGTYAATTLAGGGSTVASLSYTFPSAATWYVRVCADKSSAASTGTITESNESNNCGAWTAVVASAASVPTATLTASPTSLTTGTSTLTWSSTGATSCTGTNFATGNQTLGTAGVAPTTTKTYSLSCTGAGGTGTASATVTVASAPTVTTTANKACTGGTYLGSYADTVNSCVAYCSGLSASCCTTSYSYGDSGDSYACVAYANTTATINSATTGGCTTGGGGGGGTQVFNQTPFSRFVASVLVFMSLDPTPAYALGTGTTVCNYTTNSATLISYGPAVTASLVTNPTSISAGQPALITWSSVNATSCAGTNFSTGGAVSGSVTVNPSVTTTYSISCTNGVGGTATDSKVLTVNVFTVSCTASPSPVTVQQPLSWTSSATGGTGSYTYSWSGTDSLSGSASAATKTYSTTGEKFATLSVTSGSSTITTTCNGSPCQTTSCTCSTPGCGAVVQEGVSADVTASVPTISSGALMPGGALTFDASIENIGNNSISQVFQNRFQVDIGADGTYDVNLDTTGSSGSVLGLEFGKTCSTGTIVATDSFTLTGAGDLDTAVANLCQADAVAGQCCRAIVTASTGSGTGGGSGGTDVNLVQKTLPKSLAALYKSLALTTTTGYDIAVTVYSDPTKSVCPTGQTCYAGTWQPQAGSLYSIPFDTWLGVTSPLWSNIPLGTHKVRMCADIPSAQVVEANENNNCGPDLTFTISGFDLVGGAAGVNTGSLVAGQQVTFFGNVLNSPASYVPSSQCQATVVVSTGGTCSIAVNRDQIVWSTTGATMVTNIDPLTTSPTVPATGTNSMIVTHPGEGAFFTSQALKADMLAHGNLSFPETGFVGRSGNADQKTMDRACVMITGNTQATAKSYGARSFGSCGNNSTIMFDGTNWSNPHNCYHLSSTLDCQYPGSPYTLTGTYTFPTELGVGTHTYRLIDNASTNNTCQATITIPSSTGGLCTLTATPSIIASGGSSVLSWITNGVSAFVIDHGVGNVASSTSSSFGSCLADGELLAGGTCSQTSHVKSANDSCCSGKMVTNCPAPNEPAEAFCISAGTTADVNGITVSPTVTTTYTGTATTDASRFAFAGIAPSQFQIDTNNDGTWDTTLSGVSPLTALGVNQTTQSVSQPWTAVPGTHRVRICANTPVTASEGDTTNNCGPAFTFTVTNVQCADGADNNGNGLIDLADPACTSSADVTEESHQSATLTLTAAKATVKKGTGTTLTWSGTDIVSGSCRITSSAGDSWTLAGTSGTQTTAAITAETTYTLSCTSQQTGTATTVSRSVKLAPKFEEV